MQEPNFFSTIGMAFLTLFPLVNPVGAIPVFTSLTSTGTDEYRKSMARKTSINVFIVLVVFFFIGELLLSFFGISLPVLKIAGGLIVAHTAWEMVTSKSKLSSEEKQEAETKEDISFSPMALPLLSGPGSMSAVIGLSDGYFTFLDDGGIIIGIFLIAVSCFIALSLSLPIYKWLGQTGVGILNKIMGFFILAIAVQMIMSGLMHFIDKFSP